MKLQFTGRNLEVSQALKTFTEEKLQRLKRRYSSINEINVIFQIENLTHIAEAILEVPGAEIHAKADALDMYNAVDALVDKLTGQLTKHKEKQDQW